MLVAYYTSKKIELAPLWESLKFLSKELNNYFEKKVYILIDEFDKPVNYAISTGNFPENIERI
jgi:hypothetical protein